MFRNLFILSCLLLGVRLLLIGMELWISKRRNLSLFNKDETRVNLWMQVWERGFEYACKPAIGIVFYYVYQYRLFNPSPASPLTILWSLFLVDFAYYWAHRFMHATSWGWATHIVHHSHNKFNFTIGFRVGITLFLTGGWVFSLILPLMGIPPVLIAFSFIFINFYQFILHTELVPKLPYIDWIFGTPYHHRFHHSIEDRHMDCNYSAIFIFIDRIFGTFKEFDEAPKEYGIKNPIPLENLWVVSSHGYVLFYRALRQKFRFSSMPPKNLPQPAID